MLLLRRDRVQSVKYRPTRTQFVRWKQADHKHIRSPKLLGLSYGRLELADVSHHCGPHEGSAAASDINDAIAAARDIDDDSAASPNFQRNPFNSTPIW